MRKTASQFPLLHALGSLSCKQKGLCRFPFLRFPSVRKGTIYNILGGYTDA